MLARGGARTLDHKVKSLALYRLSYPGPKGGLLLRGFSEGRGVQIVTSPIYNRQAKILVRAYPTSMRKICGKFAYGKPITGPLEPAVLFSSVLFKQLFGSFVYSYAYGRTAHEAYLAKLSTSVVVLPARMLVAMSSRRGLLQAPLQALRILRAQPPSTQVHKGRGGAWCAAPRTTFDGQQAPGTLAGMTASRRHSSLAILLRHMGPPGLSGKACSACHMHYPLGCSVLDALSCICGL